MTYFPPTHANQRRQTLGATSSRPSERVRRTAELFKRLDCADTDSRKEILREIVVINRSIADAIATRYRGRGVGSDDLRQIAYEGLIKAVQRFDHRISADLASFAVPTIRGEIQRYFRDHGWSIRPPRSIQELQHRIGPAIEVLSQDLQREPKADEVALALGTQPADYARSVEAYGCFQMASLDQAVSAQGDTTLRDLIPAPQSDEPASEARLILAPIIDELTIRDREILYLRFYENRSQVEIGREVGLTQMQVSRVLRSILIRLRGCIEHGASKTRHHSKLTHTIAQGGTLSRTSKSRAHA